MPSSNRDLSRIPVAACRMSAELRFGDNGTDSKSVPIRILARGAAPIQHWYWGVIAHDLEGCRHKPRIPVDYCHDDREVLGYANRFDTDPEGLWLGGALVPFKDSDRTAEVMVKSKAGVPYEASIFFDDSEGLILEEVGKGASAQCNGQTIEGPAIIVRQWTLRGVAICPYGADPRTSTSFSDPNRTIAATVLSAAQQEDTEMSDSHPQPEIPDVESADVDSPAAESAQGTGTEVDGADALAASVPPVADVDASSTGDEPETPDDPVVSLSAFRALAEEFGAEIAVATVLEGGTRETALAKQVEALRAQLAAAKAEHLPGGQPARTDATHDDPDRPRSLAGHIEAGTFRGPRRK